ncbi:MAG: NUDIX domain-containing protein [Desulfovibrio sp.]|nr:NUDIX domain-containing protein [Desulfovibrio sp.]
MALREIRVAAGVVWRRGRDGACEALCCQRPQGKPMAGFWEFPGGKLEPGEDALQALARELKEELGIAVRRALPWKSFVHDYPERDLRVHLFFFNVAAFEGEIVPREGQAFAWKQPRDAGLLGFLPADASIVRELEPPAELG